MQPPRSHPSSQSAGIKPKRHTNSACNQQCVSLQLKTNCGLRLHLPGWQVHELLRNTSRDVHVSADVTNTRANAHTFWPPQTWTLVCAYLLDVVNGNVENAAILVPQQYGPWDLGIQTQLWSGINTQNSSNNSQVGSGQDKSLLVCPVNREPAHGCFAAALQAYCFLVCCTDIALLSPGVTISIAGL